MNLIPTYALSVFTFAVAGFAAAQETTYPLTVTDAKGQELTFDTAPSRLIAVYDQAYGQLSALGMAPVGATIPAEMAADAQYFLPNGTAIPNIAPFEQIDVELVSSLSPDLIIGYRDETEDALNIIAPFYAMPTSPTLGYYKENLRQLGLILNRQPQAEQAIKAMEDRLAAYARQISDPVQVMAVGYGDNGMTMFTKTFISCEILALVGTCDFPDPNETEHWLSGGTETLLAIDPEAIVLANWTGLSYQAHLTALAVDPLWAELRAVKAGRVVALETYADPYAGSVAGVAKFLDYVVPALYPDDFPNGPLSAQDVAAILSE